MDGSVYNTGSLFVHEWSNLRPRGTKNPYVEYLQSPNQCLWYRYVLVNPNPDKEIRQITFRDTSVDVRFGSPMHSTLWPG